MALLIPGAGLVDATGTLLVPGAGIVEQALATITGTLAATEAADTSGFTGSVAWPVITGALAATEDADSAAFTGTAPAVSVPSGCYVLADSTLDTADSTTWTADGNKPCPETETKTPGGSGYPVYWQGKRRKRRLEDQPNLHLKKVLDDVVNELYGELTEDDVPAEVQAKAAKLVKPFVAKKSKTLAIPPEAAVDWAALEKDAARVRQIVALWRKHELEVEIDAEDEYLLMIA